MLYNWKMKTIQENKFIKIYNYFYKITFIFLKNSNILCIQFLEVLQKIIILLKIIIFSLYIQKEVSNIFKLLRSL